MYWTTLEISAPRCALMCYPSSNITYCIACLLCIGVILLNKFNSIQFNPLSHSNSFIHPLIHSYLTCFLYHVAHSSHFFISRIDWLQQGSRELFGTVIEEQMYFLLDTSSSMAPHIQFVKDKMFVLMQVCHLKFFLSYVNRGVFDN